MLDYLSNSLKVKYGSEKICLISYLQVTTSDIEDVKKTSS